MNAQCIHLCVHVRVYYRFELQYLRLHVMEVQLFNSQWLWLDRKKRRAEFETYLRRMMKRFNKDLLMDTHKVKTQYFFLRGVTRILVWSVSEAGLWIITHLSLNFQVHLMCLIANGMFRNSLCNEPDLLAITLSLLPRHFCMVAKERMDQNYLSGLLKWCALVQREQLRLLICHESPSFSWETVA